MSTIVGYAAVFGALSDDLGGFRERVAVGAFARSIRTADVRALFNHDPNRVLGRTRAGTLLLAEDTKGLVATITPPATGWADDLVETIRRGDVDGMSFAYRIITDRWDPPAVDGLPIRTLIALDLADVSIATYPAYPRTTVGLRAIGGARSAWSGGHRLRLVG